MLPIQTERLEIRDFLSEDFAAVHAYASDPLVTRYTSFGPNTEEETREFLVRAAAEAVERPRRAFQLAILHRESGDLVGTCGLFRRREAYREYEVGYVLHRAWWGRGIAPEAVRALVGRGFRELQAHRIIAHVDPENEASRRLLARLGFRLEGHHRKDALIRGEWRDTLVFALLEEEWSTLGPGPRGR